MISATLQQAEVGLEHLFDFAIDLEPAQRIPTANGLRVTYIVASGVVDGPALRGEVLPGGGDWLLFGSDGVGRIDVRVTLRAESGALVHAAITGVADLRGGVMERLLGGEHIPWRDMYVRSTARFETADEELAWLSSAVAIGINELGPDHVDYRFFRVL